MARACICVGLWLAMSVLGCGRAHELELDATVLDARPMDADAPLDARSTRDDAPDAARDARAIDGAGTRDGATSDVAVIFDASGVEDGAPDGSAVDGEVALDAGTSAVDGEVALDAGTLDSAAADDAAVARDAGIADDAAGAFDTRTADDAPPPVDDAGNVDGGSTIAADAPAPIDAGVPGPLCAACALDADCASGPCTCGVCRAIDETCTNGIDDDCDAEVDEGCGTCGDGIVELGETCDPPSSCPMSCPDDGNPCTAEYLTGSIRGCDTRCMRMTLNSGEECNDGIFCNGFDRCMSGVCVPPSSGPCSAGAICDEASDSCAPCDSMAFEVCNLLDDDCDGVVDGPGVCDWHAVYPESCNGLDDDWDLRVDEAVWGPDWIACGTDVGACEAGVPVCSCAQRRCVGGRGPEPEACAGDGLDEDCDGVTDEGCPAAR